MHLRPADADNPNGYWEYASQRPTTGQLLDAQSRRQGSQGGITLLQYLPPQHTYKIIFMQRPMQEVLASQSVMLERRGATGGKADDQTLGTVFAQHLNRIEHWLATQKHMTVLPVHYHETIANPKRRRPGWRNFSVCHLL